MKKVLRFLFVVLLLTSTILIFVLRVRLNRANQDLLRLNQESSIVHTTMENIFLCLCQFLNVKIMQLIHLKNVRVVKKQVVINYIN